MLCAIGYSGAEVDVERVDIQFQSEAGLLPVCKLGRSIPFDEALASDILREDEIDILVQCTDGEGHRLGLRPDLRLREHQRRYRT